MKMKLPAGARYILQTLSNAGHEAYMVGGCVRDLLRGVEPHDWDICTSALPEETEQCFAGQRVIETGLKHGTVTVMDEGEPYEITTYRTEGPYSDHRRPDYVCFVPDLMEDLARRDFTMNAIAMDLEGNLQAPSGGSEDIKAGLIRCVGEPNQRLQEDGLRVMRALRIPATRWRSKPPGPSTRTGPCWTGWRRSGSTRSCAGCWWGKTPGTFCGSTRTYSASSGPSCGRW